MAAFQSGMLVEISGLPEKAKAVAGSDSITPMDLNGMKAQLVRFDREASKWIAATFNGAMITVDAQYIRPLGGDDLGDYDFVFGPKSDFDTVGEEMASTLAQKGFATMKLFVAEEDAAEMLSVVKQLEEDDQFARLAVEFERGYLGKESSAKTLLLDPTSSDAPSYVTESPLTTMDSNFGSICQMLTPHAQELLGFDMYSRTNMLLRMPLNDGDEDRYPPADVDDGDAEGYMHTMHRKKLTALQFVGPAGGTLTLTPVGEEDGEGIQLKAEPHTLVLIMANRYEYIYEPDGDSLALASFFLSEPAVYALEEISGDLDALGSYGSGPAPPPGEQVVVIGMYCRYGTGAEGRHQFWNGVGKASTDGFTDVPYLRWDNGPYYDPDQSFGGTYTKHGCFGIEGIDLFDCKFFEVSPAEAKGMDPCQRQVMEVSYMALLEGGWDKRSLQRESKHIGHFVGIDKDDWMCMSAAGMLQMSGAHGAAAAANAITSNRFSYSLNLKGASMTIDTACSSSLVCTHVSKLHLRFKEFEPMVGSIVNGLNLMLYPGPFVGCCGAGMLSHEGRCFTFNATADGYARGELCGAASFRLGNFKADSGTLCCLAGTQSNQDGRSASLTAPNGPAQEKCISAVLRECSLTPTEVDCFECHGTGTALGDPIEVGSFKKVMSVTPRVQPLVITSSKSNVGHGEGGAGFCGFMKSCLQVMHCEAAANVHLRIKNPHLDLEGFPCQMLSDGVVLRDQSAYTGVSSFGFGGTNAHAEAWGTNVLTSRGAVNSDLMVVFEKKLALAPPAEITMNGDDVNEWDTTGLDPRGEPGTKWRIFLEDDGTATWEKDDDDDLVDYGDEFSIQGSFNGWAQDALDRHPTIPGLWTGNITLGSSGEENFQVIGDGDEAKVYSPNMQACFMKGAPITGPAKAAKDFSWVIRGEPGDAYTVEWFQQEKSRSILWMKR